MTEFGLSLVTPPILLPVSVAEAKAQSEYEDTDRDAMFTAQIKAATRLVEAYTGRSLLTQTWRLNLAAFPAERLRLPRAAPLASISSVKYFTGGTLTTLAMSVYRALTDREPGEMYLANGQGWPATDTRPDAVQVEYTAGATTAADVPEELRQAILMTVSDWFQNRERPDSLPGAVRSLLSCSDLAVYAW